MMLEENGTDSQGAEKKGDISEDATSSETLSEIEEKEEVPNDEGGSENSPAPSPDGAVNSEDGERRPKDDTGSI